MKRKGSFYKNYQLFFLFTPGFAVYAGLIILAIILCFYYSFFNWDGIRQTMDFIGFSNYIRALHNKAFLTSLKVTFFYTIFGTVITNILSIALATALNRKSPITVFFRSAFFFPQLISLVAVGFIFKALLSHLGIVNAILDNYGLQKINFIADPVLAPWTILFISVWQTTGFATVLYLAGLQAIPNDLHDSARIDGANSLERFWYITFPWLAPAFTSVTVFLFTGYMKIFDLIYVLTNGGPAGRTESVATLIIKVGFNQYRISYASSIAIYMLIIVAVISMFLTNILRKREEDLIS